MKIQNGNTTDTQMVQLRELRHIFPPVCYSLTELILLEQAGVLVTSYSKKMARVRRVLLSVITVLAVG